MSERGCSIDGCERKHYAHGHCNPHYKRLKRYGDPLASGRPTSEQRFWAKVEKTDSCWNWIASANRDGYGKFSNWPNGWVLAHRFSYEQAKGQVPADRQLDHTCHNRRCVNPQHLRLVTNKQNGENRAGPQANSQTGVRGVCWNSASRKWQANLTHNGRTIYAGLFTSQDEAHAAVCAKRIELFTHNDLDRQAS